MPNPLRIKILATLILVFGSIICFSQCKNIDAEAKVITDEISRRNSIVIDFKNSSSELFKINLFGPNKNNMLDSKKTEFDNLESGKYLIIIISKKDDGDYCPKSINVTIN